MNILIVCTLISSLSFLGYTAYYFSSLKMKNEFKRFGLEKFGWLVITFQFVGAIGLLLGFLYQPLLTISSFGLSLLMFLGVFIRIKIKDSFWISLPALFYMVLNTYIFWASLHWL